MLSNNAFQGAWFTVTSHKLAQKYLIYNSQVTVYLYLPLNVKTYKHALKLAQSLGIKQL